MRAPEQRVDLREESVIGTGNGPSSRISMINGPPNNLPSVTEDGGEGEPACHNHPCREGIASPHAYDNCAVREKTVNTSNVFCACSITCHSIMLVASLLHVGPRNARKTSLFVATSPGVLCAAGLDASRHAAPANGTATS